MDDSISIKGTREGLTVTLRTDDLGVLLKDLAQHLDTQGAFFRGGQVALEAGDWAIDEAGLEHVSDLLTKHEMTLRTLISTNEVTQKACKAMGLRLIVPDREGEDAAPKEPSLRRAEARQGMRSLDGSKGVLIRHRVRSGQVVRHTGHVVIIGDVNIGAEIVAGGDIIIWGRLLGTAQAGAVGNEAAIVCALDLSPLQLRIGNVIARPEENADTESVCPEVAYVRDDMIVIKPWDRASWGV